MPPSAASSSSSTVVVVVVGFASLPSWAGDGSGMPDLRWADLRFLSGFGIGVWAQGQEM